MRRWTENALQLQNQTTCIIETEIVTTPGNITLNLFRCFLVSQKDLAAASR